MKNSIKQFKKFCTIGATLLASGVLFTVISAPAKAQNEWVLKSFSSIGEGDPNNNNSSFSISSDKYGYTGGMSCYSDYAAAVGEPVTSVSATCQEGAKVEWSSLNGTPSNGGFLITFNSSISGSTTPQNIPAGTSGSDTPSTAGSSVAYTSYNLNAPVGAWPNGYSHSSTNSFTIFTNSDEYDISGTMNASTSAGPDYAGDPGHESQPGPSSASATTDLGFSLGN